MLKILALRGKRWQDKRKFHNKELHNLYYSTIIIIGIKLSSQDSIVSIVTRLQTGQQRNCGSFPSKRQVGFSKATRQVHGPLIQWGPAPHSPGLKRSEHQADSPSPFSIKFKNKWNKTSSSHTLPSSAQDQLYLYYQSKKDEMEEVRITYGIDENSHSVLFWNSEKSLFQDLDIDGRILHHNTSCGTHF
jgi:hypothetical protein